MLDVHPPHEKMHGFKDFLLHLFTITVGLLIALALEGCAERWHHRELRREADENLRQEIRDNTEEIATMRSEIAREETNLTGALAFLQARRAKKEYDIHSINLGFSIGNLSDASSRTASATGALSYMEYSHVQRYASVYQLQDKFDVLQLQTFNDFLQLQSYVVNGFDPDKVTPEEAVSAAVEVRRAFARLKALDALGDALSKDYDTVLKKN
jgi:hypothetical protein